MAERPARHTDALAKACPLCGQPNQCGLLSSMEPCWCTGVKISTALLEKIPQPLQNRACLCNGCIQDDIDKINEH